MDDFSLPVNHLCVGLGIELQHWNLIQAGLVISMVRASTETQDLVHSLATDGLLLVSQHSKQKHFRVSPVGILRNVVPGNGLNIFWEKIGQLDLLEEVPGDLF